MDIDPKKQAIIDHKNGPLLVIAGPGAGKTMAIVECVVKLIGESTVAPQRRFFMSIKKDGCLNSAAKVFGGISYFYGMLLLIVVGTVKENEVYGASATFWLIGIILFLISKTSVSNDLNHPTVKNAGVFLTANL